MFVIFLKTSDTVRCPYCQCFQCLPELIWWRASIRMYVKWSDH